VFDGETAVGRMYERDLPGGIKWRWSVYGLAIQGADVPGGLAESRDDAMAAFEAAWDKAGKR
jgi:hypothetical protein